ncbi:TonB-dependent receptor [Sphingobacterium sp. 2149]|uniref:TonB-dependent receptor n=1 Tax=Sphingobacterium sp. 2149 TaxID=2817763 RepID=UPI001AE797A7|nr:TonB-dependent receptor [Sphingobacterium sp. 2149]MDR6735576.1 iron complex outermembrane receptor protein [Sphingobacterium sp. 2149]
MRKIPMLVATIWSLQLTFTYAQEKQLFNGTVLDEYNAPLAGATITVLKTNQHTATDHHGQFILPTLSKGTYDIRIHAIGYKTIKQKISIDPAHPFTLTFPMFRAEEALETVEIYGRKEKSYRNTQSFIGSKTETKLRDLPQSVSYATKELIADQGLMRVGEIVKNFSGVNQFTFYDDITIRGFRINGGSNTQLVNGMRTTTGFWKQPLANYLERVEVLKGPSSALFGNASPGGVVNRVTKKPLDEARKSLQFSVGSFNNLRALADFTGPMTSDKTLLYRLNIGYENAQSFRDLQFDKNLVLAPSFSFIPSENTRINFDMVYNDSKSRLDRGQSVFANGDLYSTPISQSMSTANDFLNEQTYMVTASLNHRFNDKLSFNASYMKTGYAEDLSEHRSANAYAVDGKGANIENMVARQVFIRNRKRFVDNITAFFNYNVNTGVLSHKLIAGYDYAQEVLPVGGSQLTASGYRNKDNTGSIAKFDPKKINDYLLDKNGNPVPNVSSFDLSNPLKSQQLQDESKYFFAPASTTSVAPTYYHLNALYVQDQLTLGPLQLLLGLRYENYKDIANYKTDQAENVHQDVLLPRFGAVYTINPQINLYGTYVKGYNPQTASALANPNAGGPFDPLENDMTEFGLKTGWLDGKLQASTAIYQINQKNTLYPAPTAENADLMEQIGKERSKGIEFDIQGQILPYWSIIASYAYNDARITEGGNNEELNKQKPNAPQNTANIWTRFSIPSGKAKGLGIGVGANYVDKRYLSLNLNQTIPSYSLLNAALYYSIGKVQLQANFNNITNKTHWVGGYDYIRLFPGAPRNFLFTLGYTF